jgi:hypothetical protein
MYVVIPSIIATGVFGAGFYISSVSAKRKLYSKPMQPMQPSQYPRVNQYPVQSRAAVVNDSKKREQIIANTNLLTGQMNELKLEIANRGEAKKRALEEQQKQQKIAENAQTERKRIEATTLAQASAKEVERLRKEQDDKKKALEEKKQVLTTTPQGTVQANNSNARLQQVARRLEGVKKKQEEQDKFEIQHPTTTTPQGKVQANNSNARLQQVARRLDELKINKKRPAPVSTPQGTVQANNSNARLQQVARKLERVKEEQEKQEKPPTTSPFVTGKANNSQVDKELNELNGLANKKIDLVYKELIPRSKGYTGNISEVFDEIINLTKDTLDWGIIDLKTKAADIIYNFTQNTNEIKLRVEEFKELIGTTKSSLSADKTKHIEILKSLLENIKVLIKDIESIIGKIGKQEEEINKILADIKEIQRKQPSPAKGLTVKELIAHKKDIFSKGIGYYNTIIYNDKLIDDSWKLLFIGELDDKLNQLALDASMIKNGASDKFVRMKEDDEKIDALLKIINSNNSKIDIKIDKQPSLISIKEIIEEIKDIVESLEKDEKKISEIVTEISKLISEKVSKRKPNIGTQGRAFKGSLSRSSSAASYMSQQEQPSPKGKQGSPFSQASISPFPSRPPSQNGQTNNSSSISKLKESARDLVVEGNNHIANITNNSNEINTLINNSENRKFNKINRIGIAASTADLKIIMKSSERINKELNEKMEYINKVKNTQDINNTINEIRNNIEILGGYDKEMDTILEKVKKIVETKQNNSNSDDKCSQLGGFTYKSNSCYLDSLLMALFHSKDKYINDEILTKNIKNDGSKLYELKIEIQTELNRLANLIYDNKKDEKDTTTTQLRKLFTDASELIKDKLGKGDLLAHNWISHQRDPIDVYTLLEILFEIKPELSTENKRYDNNDKENPGKPKITKSTDSIFIKTYFDIKKEEPDKIYKISEMIPTHGVETDGIWGKTENGRVKGDRVISVTDVTYIKSPILGIITPRISHSTGRKSEVQILPSLSLKLEGNTKYLILKSIIVHDGTASEGHYTAYIKCSDNWYLYDDRNFKDNGMVLKGTDEDILKNKDVLKNSHALFYFP